MGAAKNEQGAPNGNVTPLMTAPSKYKVQYVKNEVCRVKGCLIVKRCNLIILKQVYQKFMVYRQLFKQYQ